MSVKNWMMLTDRKKAQTQTWMQLQFLLSQIGVGPDLSCSIVFEKEVWSGEHLPMLSEKELKQVEPETANITTRKCYHFHIYI